MTDDEFLAAFRARTLPRPEWTHTAHLRMAFLVLMEKERNYPGALACIRDGIRAYNTARGNPHGYHETVTVAFVCLMHDRLRRDPVSGVNFAAFRAAHGDLFHADVLLDYYTRERLYSEEARAKFLPADYRPLPEP